MGALHGPVTSNFIYLSIYLSRCHNHFHIIRDFWFGGIETRKRSEFQVAWAALLENFSELSSPLPLTRYRFLSDYLWSEPSQGKTEEVKGEKEESASEEQRTSTFVPRPLSLCDACSGSQVTSQPSLMPGAEWGALSLRSCLRLSLFHCSTHTHTILAWLTVICVFFCAFHTLMHTNDFLL